MPLNPAMMKLPPSVSTGSRARMPARFCSVPVSTRSLLPMRWPSLYSTGPNVATRLKPGTASLFSRCASNGRATVPRWSIPLCRPVFPITGNRRKTATTFSPWVISTVSLLRVWYRNLCFTGATPIRYTTAGTAVFCNTLNSNGASV